MKSVPTRAEWGEFLSASRRVRLELGARGAVQLVGRLSLKGRVGKFGVTLVDVERDEVAYRGKVVDRVRIELLLCERPPL